MHSDLRIRNQNVYVFIFNAGNRYGHFASLDCNNPMNDRNIEISNRTISMAVSVMRFGCKSCTQPVWSLLWHAWEIVIEFPPNQVNKKIVVKVNYSLSSLIWSKGYFNKHNEH